MPPGAAEALPLHRLITQSVAACDVDVHANLWSSVVLTGGASLAHGLVPRLQSELTLACPQVCTVVHFIPRTEERAMLTSSRAGHQI